MFFINYLGRELRRRTRQAIFIALGLALGIGLVITVMGASSGVKAAEGKVLRSLYGIGTDVTVTEQPKLGSGVPGSGHGTTIQVGPAGAQECVNGKCHTLSGGVIEHMGSMSYAPLSDSVVGSIARLRGVSAASGGLMLTDNRTVIPKPGSGNFQPPTSSTVDGTDIAHPALGPLSDARLGSGRMFTAADKDSDVAVVDSGYATAQGLKTGKTVDVDGVSFKIIGVVDQPQASSPPDVYIPLARAQALGLNPATGDALTGEINTVYVTAASASAIPAVQHEIGKLLPTATVTSSSSLASEITGSVSSADKLAGDLGHWLAVLVLIAAFALASLLTMAAVSRRVQEFGTLKALGWRGSRIVGQVLGESVSTGILGGLAGVGLGFAGVAIINKSATKLSATLPSAAGSGGQQIQSINGVARSISLSHPASVSVPLTTSVTSGAILAAVLLALAGGLLAGSFGGWRAARLRPAVALSKVA